MNYDQYEGLARALFEESHEAQFLLDPETGHVLDANAAAQRLCGASPRAFLNTPVHDLLRAVGGVRAIDFPMSAWKVDRPYAEWGCRFRASQGSEVPIDVTVTRLTVRPRPLALLRVREVGSPAAVPPPPASRGRL